MKPEQPAETVLYSFYSSQYDGMNPNSALVEDSSGNFYGTTEDGGEYFQGTVFKLTPSGSGS